LERTTETKGELRKSADNQKKKKKKKYSPIFGGRNRGKGGRSKKKELPGKTGHTAGSKILELYPKSGPVAGPKVKRNP